MNSMSKSIDPSYAGEGIYRENIMDHFMNPRNFGRMENPDIEHMEFNPLCGDRIQVFLKLEGDRVIEAKFSGSGCAISRSAASMLTETLKGKTLDDVKGIRKEDVLEMLAIPIGPVRMKCAMLSLDTLRNALHIHENYKENSKAL